MPEPQGKGEDRIWEGRASHSVEPRVGHPERQPGVKNTNHLTGPEGVSWDVLGGILSARRNGRLRVVLSFLYIMLPLFRIYGGYPGRLALDGI